MKRFIIVIFLLSLFGCARYPLSDLQSEKFSSGMNLYLLTDHTLPTTSYSVVVKSGSVRDPENKEGLAYLTVEMLLRGTKNRNRRQILDDIEYLGASLSASADYDFISLSGSALASTQERYLELLADILLNPTFPEAEFEKLKDETVGQLRLLTEDDGGLNRIRFLQWLYKGHPYGRLSTGTPDSIKTITLDDVKNFYKANFVGGNILFAAAGDVKKDNLVEMIGGYFPGLRKGEVEDFKYPQLSSITRSRILLVDKPDRTQTQILMGHYGVVGNSSDYYPLAIANTAFGGTFTARLMQEVRVKRGWSYGAYSVFKRRKSVGEFLMLTYPATNDSIETIKLTREMVRDLIKNGVSREEFKMSQNFAVRDTAFDTETPGKAMGEFIKGVIMGWDGYPKSHRKKLKRVSFSSVNETIPKYLKTEPFVISMVCTAERFKQPLRQLFPDAIIRVVPYDEWSLGEVESGS